jgi:hypothetical protein
MLKYRNLFFNRGTGLLDTSVGCMKNSINRLAETFCFTWKPKTTGKVRKNYILTRKLFTPWNDMKDLKE